MSSEDAFSVLGIPRQGATLKDVKRAYAVKLKITRPDDDPAGFMALRDALEDASSQIRWAELDGITLGATPDEDYDPDDAEDSEISADTAGPAGAPLADNDGTDPFAAPARVEYGAEWSDADEEQDEAEDAGDDAEPLSPEYASAEHALIAIDVLLEDEPAAAAWENWTRILDAEELSSIDAFQIISYRLRDLICQRTDYDPESTNAIIKNGLTPEIMLKLDERFGWSRQSVAHWFERHQNIWIRRLIEDAEFRTGKSRNGAWGKPSPRQVEVIPSDGSGASTPDLSSTNLSILWVLGKIVIIIVLLRVIVLLFTQ